MHLWIRLPNWLGDVVMTLPLLRALRASRPDAEITIIGKAQFRVLLETWEIADCFLPVPPKGFGYFRYFWKLRGRFPDCYLLFTNSVRSDLEALFTGCPQRFGILRCGQLRPFLTHTFTPKADFDETPLTNYRFGSNFSATSASLSPPVGFHEPPPRRRATQISH